MYCQFHYISDQGTGYLTQEEGVKAAGENPDRSNQDLFEAIERGEYPSWTFCVQTMTPEQAEKFRYNILDLTKVRASPCICEARSTDRIDPPCVQIWSHKEFPLRPVGKLTLNENVKNYFAEIEQVAFAPSHLIPGIEPSADPVLQSRLFSYPDTHRHRLGVNYAQLPVNAPLHPPANFQRDGLMAFHNQGNRPNYKSSIQELSYKPAKYDFSKHEKFVGECVNQLTLVTELDFEQPRELWEKVFDDGARERFVSNVAGHLSGAKSQEIKQRTLSVFGAVHPDISARIAKAMGCENPKPFQPASADQALFFRANI